MLRWIRAAPALAAFVFLSSWLGLNGYGFGLKPEDDVVVGLLAPLPHQWDWFAKVWSDSLAADAVFVLGSVAACLVAWRVARRQPAYGVAAGFALAWVTYAASFALLSEKLRGSEWVTWSVLALVGGWGLVGLLFASLAPVLAARPRPDARALAATVAFAVALGALGALAGVTRAAVGPFAGPLAGAAQALMGAATGPLLAGGAAAGTLAFRAARARGWLAGLAVAAAAFVPLVTLAFMLAAELRAGEMVPDPRAAAAGAFTTGALALGFGIAAPLVAARIPAVRRLFGERYPSPAKRPPE